MMDAPHIKPGLSVWAEIYLNRELRVGAPHGTGADRGAPVFCSRAPPRDPTGGLLRRERSMIATQLKPVADRPWLDPSAKPQIVIDGVGKTYGNFTAVDNVSLQIYKGEMFALVGASGCGKTTLLRMLAGFARQSSGAISIDGVEMSGVPPHERPVNMMFQSYALFPHMTVERNVGYGIKRLPLDAATRAEARPGSARHGAAGTSRAAQAAPTLRRPAAARGPGPRADPSSQGAAAG